MRIELPKTWERFGAVKFGELQKVFELDCGEDNGACYDDNHIIQQIPYPLLNDVYKDMALVVPVRSERLKLIEGVLCGIPHTCMIIIVSNSPTTPVDRFKMEQDALRDFCAFVGKNALIAHQKDKALAEAFDASGYTSILDENGKVRDGKAEGMLIGTVLAWLAGKKYVGFVDSDNYFPGSVEEYIREYASGFTLSRSPYAMVRIAWHSKPKIVESKLFFRKWGRTSSGTNQLLNKMISHYTGFETEIIKTGNAGEHALTMTLALNLDYSEGYSIEPYHIINLLERYGGIIESPVGDAMQKSVEVYQIESRNPHLHEAGDKEHIDRMSYLAMQVVYHSPVCPEPLKKEIRRSATARGHLKAGEDVPTPRRFPPLSTIDHDSFMKEICGAPYGRLLEQGIGQESR
jgi:mannosyl-3-phosphoglycerate synthase